MEEIARGLGTLGVTWCCTAKPNVLYEVTVDSLDFTPSDECVEVRFVSPEEARKLELFENVQIFADLFDSTRHQA